MNTIRIGLISDTHGLLRPEARVALAGVECIIHAGDICNTQVLDQLAQIAPVVAVRGNNDRSRAIAPKPIIFQRVTKRLVGERGKVSTRRFMRRDAMEEDIRFET